MERPKGRNIWTLLEMIDEAVRIGDAMIGDLTHNDAMIVKTILDLMGLKAEIDHERDDEGRLVESDDWKMVVWDGRKFESFLVKVPLDYVPEDGERFDAVSDALSFSEIPHEISKILSDRV